MVIDIEVSEGTLPVVPGAKVLATLSRPVLQRLLDGRTRGIALRSLGPIAANFYSSESAAAAPRLLFNVQ
jgi:hypothetical protein